MSNKELSNKELSNKELSNKELSNKELSNKELSNKELSNKELGNKELSRSVKKGIYCLALILILLTIDQIIKVSVKTNMALYDEIYIFDWFRIRFIENNGMAWGMELGSKLLLSIFRIIAVAFGCWYVWRQIRCSASYGYLTVLSMILAGASGNIFDSLFYGQIFTESTPFAVSQLTAFGEGYAPMLMGKVVDMFYFPIIDTILPTWIPIWGGDHFVFFSPIFNFADACISVAVIVFIIFFREKIKS